ncbi:acyl-coenzyme A thioesterase [Leucosporidium creatinivorum]|uniref:Acyl-coenzyme A thioesterase n=1 Tax=Leucosporidium creatinivorum TaxID=106004 RepID=A0A1Y2G1W6_9BASI|nr:acyl-coenzyme A thioesterase [Leucosporidium creatinivorum]
MPVDPAVLTILRDRCERVLNMGHHGFGAEQAKRCRLADIEVEGVKLAGDGETVPERGATATTTVELEVDESCCNISGNAHGGFLAWLIDHCSSLSIFCLSAPDRWTTSGVSTNINTFYISAAPLGTPLRVVSKIIQIGKSSATLEVRVENRDTNKLVALGTHVKQDVKRSPEATARIGKHLSSKL